MSNSRNAVLWITAAILGLCGLGSAIGGIWLLNLGGSPYYALAAVAFLLTAGLLVARQEAALFVYAVLVLGTLVWALWEVGFDWWPLAARGDVIFILGLVLLTPWIAKPLRRADVAAAMDGKAEHGPLGGRLVLGGSLALVLAVAAVSWFTDLHAVQGVAAAPRPLPAGDQATIPAGEWQAYGRTGYGQRYSPLDQITPENVADLELAWEYHTGDAKEPGDPVETTFEATPLKVGDRLFFCTPHQSVIALDADTGKEVWRYDPKVGSGLALQHLTCRGLSFDPAPSSVSAAGADRAAGCGARLFMPTADGRLIALRAENGTLCESFGGGDGAIDLWQSMPNVKPGAYYSTSPVIVAGGVIVVGGTVLDNVSVNEASGVIRGFDAVSGDLVWNFDSGKPEATRPIAPGETYTPNSPNSWAISSVDEALGLVYVPLGNQPPDQWGGKRSPAVERFSSSVVALDLATGAVRWVFQTVHHDLWDYDVPAQPTLIDLTVRGQSVPALVQPTKQGELFVLDRRTGEPVLPVIEVSAPGGAAAGDFTAPTQPVSALSFDPPALEGKDMWGATMFDQLACRIQFERLDYKGRYTPPSENGSLIYPGNFGVFNWGGIAVDPERQIAFTTPTYLAFVSRLIPRADDKTLYVQDGGKAPEGGLPSLNENFGAPFAVELMPFTSVLGLPCQSPPWGYVAAADLTTGKIVWQHKNGTVEDLSPIPVPLEMGVPNLGGPIMTAGGVAFLSGTLDYYLRAYDVSNGAELWKSRLPAGGQATPMTYLGRDGTQYVLVVAGGHGSLGTKTGDSVVAYKLPAAR